MPKNHSKNLQALNRAKIFVDYKPAELHKGKEWRVEYYAKIPAQNQMKRFRKRVPNISSQKEHEKYAKKIIASINQKLENGWSPFYEDSNNGYKTIDCCFDTYLKKY